MKGVPVGVGTASMDHEEEEGMLLVQGVGFLACLHGTKAGAWVSGGK